MGRFAQMGYCTVYPEAAGGGGELPCKKLDNARWKIGIKSLKETNLGTMVQDQRQQAPGLFHMGDTPNQSSPHLYTPAIICCVM